MKLQQSVNDVSLLSNCVKVLETVRCNFAASKFIGISYSINQKMKTITATASPVNENWNGNNHRLKQIFMRITGYDIMFKASRKDLVPQKTPTFLEKLTGN